MNENTIHKPTHGPDKLVFLVCITILPFAVFGDMQFIAMMARSVLDVAMGITTP